MKQLSRFLRTAWLAALCSATLFNSYPLFAATVPPEIAAKLTPEQRELAAHGGYVGLLLEKAGIKGGFVLLLGCGEAKDAGKLAAGLGFDKRFTVHGLDADPAIIEAARQWISGGNPFASGGNLTSRVSVELFNGDTLPFCDNLINLVVVEKPSAVPMAEMMRVLAPGGVVLVKQGKDYARTVKPRPGNIDEWTHFLHDAGNNAVAKDTAVGAPRSLQWVAPPLWLRSHETPSGIESVVTGNGRLFYFFDQGIVGITDQRLPEKWSLICRDAFNGKLLWERPMGKFGWPTWAPDKFAADWTVVTGGRVVVPFQNQRRLVVDGDRLYATLAYDAPLSILDAASGEPIATVEKLGAVREILSAQGVVVTYSDRPGPPAEGSDGKGKNTGKKAGKNAKRGAAIPGKISGIDGKTGAILWQADVESFQDLSLAIDQGRVFYVGNKTLSALELRSGKPLWQSPVAGQGCKTLVANAGHVVILGNGTLESHEAAGGKMLWQKEIKAGTGPEGLDLFVINGVVWPGATSPEKEGQSAKGKHKGADVALVGFDLKTGAERKRLEVDNLRSSEHHHRCYRNKATDRFIITSLEGAEFVDLQGDAHSQNNFVRGSCMYGMMPANGLLYVPSDQCFCDPGAKMLGFVAMGPEPAKPLTPTPDAQRLVKGPAYGTISSIKSTVPDDKDWPTYRHDSARHGSTPASVSTKAQVIWKREIQTAMTQPVVSNGRLFMGLKDERVVLAMSADDGRPLWRFAAGGRIDSPPTILGNGVLFGAADGYVYCVRADDGVLAWKFLAAPVDRRIGCFDQFESAWPVHGSVLVQNGLAYVTAGRSTYSDGGIHLYALDALTGEMRHHKTLVGPWPDRKTTRDVSFYINGANAELLCAENDSIFMRQKQFSLSLEEVKTKVLSEKGEANIGLHVFSTSGLLDDSWYNRAFWMYSKRWPGFQLANQAPKSGQLLVVDDTTTYAVQPFVNRNVHSPMFFPGKQGYLLYADKNTTEPQIVGEEGARKPVEWLPQSAYGRGGGRPAATLDSDAFGLDKMIGYTRADAPVWKQFLPVRIRAMVKANDILFVAGPPDELDPKDPFAAFEGRKGAKLLAISAKDGAKLAEIPLQAMPAFDGMIAAGNSLYMVNQDGTLLCLR